jgi:NADH-ubiquinone oxidoreductase chain 5
MLLYFLVSIIIFLPLLSSILVGFFGYILGKHLSCLISVTCIIITALSCLVSFYIVGLNHTVIDFLLYSWIKLDYISIEFRFLFDSLTVTMLVIITVISSLVHVYSTEYMSEDPHFIRFMSYLSLFTFFMILLVTSNNFLQMFFGWEGVGLSSYLLINFWYTRIQANKAAMKAMIVNKIGDISLLFALFFLFFYFKSLDYSIIFTLAPFFTFKYINVFGYDILLLNIICFFLLIGAVGKSAQLGLHTWLPDAMEGPTPVSALIHAATMVTAGVFLIIRCSPLFEYSPVILQLVLFIGGLTAFFAATIGAFQNDLKKVIAYSTCSQLGYMVYVCGLSNYSVSLFHLFNHAFFKALLFLSAGSIIHAMSDEQDMRKFGGLQSVLPVTYVMIFIASLALMGFPYLTGFYSKDIIIELAYSKYLISGQFIHWLGLLTAGCTAYYSIKSLFLTFLTKANGFKQVFLNAHEGSYTLLIPLMVLGFLSIFVGFLTKDLFIGLGSDFFDNSIFILDNNLLFLQSEFIPFYIKNLPVLFSSIGIFLYFILLHFNIKSKTISKKLYYFFQKKWYLDLIYNKFIVEKSFDVGYYVTFLTLDKGFIEFIGPKGISSFVINLSNNIKKEQLNTFFDHLFFLILGLVFSIVLLVIILSN